MIPGAQAIDTPYPIHNAQEKPCVQAATNPLVTFFTCILVFFLLISALSIVYIKDLNRRLFIQYQVLQQEKNQILVDWGKLLLEQSTWSQQARIQLIAGQNLNMRVPLTTDVVLVPVAVNAPIQTDEGKVFSSIFAVANNATSPSG